ncbi:interleukin-13 receptor subunit alpha-1-like [Centroberyx affinis]|uniref:interleukin-13 receptor subunit alpha-1-like n=1 Tax=Centroberyx affinis TaxID=166261 RepID=UPI003A5BD49B
MKLSPVHLILWSSLLVLWAHRSSQHVSLAEAPDSYLCQDEDLYIDQTEVQRGNSSGPMQLVDEEEEELKDNASCLLYPTNTLNCSWSFHASPKERQSSVFVIICEGEEKHSFEEVRVSEEGVQSKSVVLCQHCIDYRKLYVILHVNVSQPNMWTTYTTKYSSDNIEVLPPPHNISAVVRDGGLLVTWGQPYSRSPRPAKCFTYQLDISGQERLKDVTGQRNYTEPNADPTRTYRVRMRTRTSSLCIESPHWSDWSHTVTVAPTESPLKLNCLVIVTISLGIPMILLAVLLLFRLQRVSKLLFPPIPRPSPKYKYFLEKTDTFLFSPPVQLPKYIEEITEVEEAEQSPEKTFQ